ncbi:MAG: PAS domain S-box protein [Spirochaetes bacterium]|nr:PAS domain S-box protein [Spirochaetota bacterium]
MKTILLVEDEVLIALSEKMTLEKYGYSVITATTGEKAVEAVNKTLVIDLILMDINLGKGIDGTQAAELILKDHDIPIVFVSNHSEREVVEKTEKITSYGYVVKSSSITVLDASIKMAFKLFKTKQDEKAKGEALQESQRRLTDIIEFLPDATLAIDSEKHVIIWNKAIEKMTGIPATEMIGKGDYAYTIPFYGEARPNLMDMVFKNQDEITAKYPHITREGDTLMAEVFCNALYNDKGAWVSAKVSPLNDRFGNIIGVIESIRDITERKLAEKVTRESEERFQRVSAMTSDMAYSCRTKEDGCFSIEWITGAADRITGYSSEEIKAQGCWRFLVVEEDQAVFEEHVIGLAPGSQDSCEFRIRRRNGGIVWIASFAECVSEPRTPGSPLLYGGLVDITERKRVEEVLAQTRQNFETFFNTIDEFLFVLDEKGNIIHTNTTVIDRLGYTREELCGKSVLMVHPAGRRAEAGRIVDEMLRGLTEFCPVPVITKSGVQIPVETRVKRGIWDDKPVIFGVTKDISRIQLSEEKFSKVFHINPSACGLSDLATGKYVEVNNAFYALFGFDKDEVMGKTAMDLGILTPVARNSILLKSDSDGNVINAETELRAKNGDIKHVVLSSENIHIQDKQYRFTAVHDITERKNAEDEIKTLLAEKELILKEVHHRIKNNMNTINSLLSIHGRTLKDPSAIESLEDAGSRVRSMMVLYDKLYESVDFTEMSVREYLPALVDQIVSNFPKGESVKIEKRIDDFVLEAKRLQPLGIIINELLTNIMKYAFDDGDDGLITVSATLMDDRVAILVQDNGNGMPESVTFENSTGFGLMLVKMLVEQLEGTIRIEREKGTRIVLEFSR